jgi:hypothetical protein
MDFQMKGLKLIPMAVGILWAATAARAQVLEDFGCASPAMISNGKPAVVTCPLPHGYNQRAFFTWSFNGPSANGSSITIDSKPYTMVTTIDNSAPNQVLIGAVPGASAANLMHAINDDGVGKGFVYSGATTAHPTVLATIIENIAYPYVNLWYKVAGPAGIGVTGTSSSGANGSFDTPAMRMEWPVDISGGTGGWASIGSNQSYRNWLARYLSPTTFVLYTTGGVPYDSTTNGPYIGQSVRIVHSSGDGTDYPYPYTGESWSLKAKITPDPYFQLTVPGCSNPAHESECAQGYRVPEVSKYPGLSQRISSFTVQGGVATISLVSAFPSSATEMRVVKNGSLVWVRNIADPAGTWTHTSTHPNGGAGTATNHLVKFAAGSDAVQALENGDRGGAIGVCQSGCGTSGTASIADAGLVTCTFDSATTAGHSVVVSTYDDRCHDSGPNFSVSPQTVGTVLDSGPAGNHQVWWNGLNRAFMVQSVNGPGDGSGVTQVTVNVPGYPDGTYPEATLPGYAGNSTPVNAFVASTYTVSPYVVFLGRQSGGYFYPGSTLQRLAKNQQAYTSPQTNRIEFWLKWGGNQKVCNSESQSEIGTFLIPPGYTNLAGHYYHGIDTPSYANQWAHYIWNQTPMHGEGVPDTSYNYPNDPGLSGHPFGWHGRRSYFDSLATFYFDMQGLSCRPNVSGQTILLSPITYSSAADEPEELVLTRGGAWSPARFQASDGPKTPTGTQGYDLFWGGPKNLQVQYEVRYSTDGSLKALGFSKGICKSGSTACDGTDRVSTNGTTSQVYYQSATMPEAKRIWWGIKPVSVPVIGTSSAGQNPAWVITPVSLGLSAVGDHVMVAGVKGNTAVNQSNAATVGIQPYQFWIRFDPSQQTQGGLTYSNSNGAIQIRLPSHGYNTGDIVQLATASPAGINQEWTITVIDASTFVLNSSSYAACPCSGGWTRREIDSTLTSIVADGVGQCTVNLTTHHNLVPGWPIMVSSSTSSKLTPRSDGSPAAYTVTSTPTPTSFVFGCPGVQAGTYNNDPDTGLTLNVAAYPGIALNVQGNADYAGGGSIFSTEDNKGFAEIELWPYETPSPHDHSAASRVPLTIAVLPPGGGTISPFPGTVGGTYDVGTTVTLTATPSAGYVFSGFEGDVTGVNPMQPVQMSGPRQVVARFRPVGDCSYRLSSGTFFKGTRGGSGSVHLSTDPGCPWTASSQTSWLTLTGAASGTGPADVVFAVSGNGGAARSGTLTVSGQTLAVKQTGKPFQAGKTGIFRAGRWMIDRQGDGTVYQDAAAQTSSGSFSQPGDIPMVGDWNGDGSTKTGVFRNGLWILDYNGDGAVNLENPAPQQVFRYTSEPGDIPVVGDWNGDGHTKTGVFRNGLWILDYNGDGAVNLENPTPQQVFRYTSTPGDIPVVGDWNGDGRTKTGVFRNGLWILDYNGDGSVNLDNPSPEQVFRYTSAPGDIPVVGDWSGDGRTKTGVFRNGLWILDYNGDGSVSLENPAPQQVFRYTSAPGDIPVVGDWNGDGRTKTGVFRNGLWVLDYNADGKVDANPGPDRVIAFDGKAGDTPLVGRWSYRL